MATVTSKATGDWSAGSTWDSDPAIPVNGDTVIIGGAHEVTFDVDQSGFANGVDLTVTGTFTWETAAGAYYLMCSADIDGAGTFQAGTSGVALPSTVTSIVDFNAGSFHFDGSGGLTVLLYCTEPTYTYVKLSAAEASGQTILSVDTDVTGDIWNANDSVLICNMAANGDTSPDVDITTINATAAGPHTITVNDALTTNMADESYIILCTRNIKVTNSEDYLYRDLDSTCFIRCENDCLADDRVGFQCIGMEFAGVSWESAGNTDIMFQNCDNTTFSGIITGKRYNGILQSDAIIMSGLIVGCNDAISFNYNPTISGEIRGCDQGVTGCFSAMITSTAVFSNNYRPIYNSKNTFCYGTISNSNRNVELEAGGIFNCTMSGASTGDFMWVTNAQCFNTTFGSATEFFGYDAGQRGKRDYVESFDHDGVTNAFKAWCRGGIVTSQTASPPTGYTQWYEHVCEDTAQIYPVYRQFETTVQPGTAVEVEGQIRIADGETTVTGVSAPALQIIDKFADPLVDSTASPLDEDEIPEPDGGVEAGWQAVSVIWANQGDAPRTVIIRMIAYHDGGGDDIDIDEVWNIADYQDQINDIHTRLGVPADIDSGGATIADNLKKIADDNDGADFDAGRESLNAILHRGDLAWVTGAGASAQNIYTIATLTRTVGDDDGGADTDVDVVDGNLFSTGEVNSTTKLEVDATFTATDAGENPLSVSLWGYYAGGGGHHIIAQAYNYVDSTFEEIGQIGIDTEANLHSFPMNAQHINTSTGAMAIKFIHSTVGTGIISHAFHIDKLIVGTTEESLLNSNVDDILEDTNEMQGKLPDNDIMGSSDKEDYNDDILAIKSNLGQVHTTEDESPGGGGGRADRTSGIAEGC